MTNNQSISADLFDMQRIERLLAPGAQGGFGPLGEATIAHYTGWKPDRLRAALDALQDAGKIVLISPGGRSEWWLTNHARSWWRDVPEQGKTA